MKFFYRLILLIISFVFFEAGSASFAFAANDENSAYTPPSINYTIVVDPGHGGADPGSIGYKTKVKESDLNLKLSLMLADKLRTVGIKVIMTRTDNNSLAQGSGKGFKKQDMKLRKEMINKIRPNMVVSVHMNSYTNHTLRGAKVFYDKTSDISRQIAESIQLQFAQNLEASNSVASVGDYYMLQCTESPSVIAECGFLSNKEERDKLVNDNYQKKLALNIKKGIVDYFANV